MTRLVKVFKGSRKADTYVFVDFKEGLSRVPEPLLAQLGTTSEVMSLKLSADRPLARANAKDVLDQIDRAGFYLQLPPPDDSLAPGAGARSAPTAEPGRED